MQMADDRDMWWAVVNTVTNLRFPNGLKIVCPFYLVPVHAGVVVCGSECGFAVR